MRRSRFKIRKNRQPPGIYYAQAHARYSHSWNEVVVAPLHESWSLKKSYASQRKPWLDYIPAQSGPTKPLHGQGAKRQNVPERELRLSQNVIPTRRTRYNASPIHLLRAWNSCSPTAIFLLMVGLKPANSYFIANVSL